MARWYNKEQDSWQWKAFSELFYEENGFSPSYGDSLTMRFFEYFKDGIEYGR